MSGLAKETPSRRNHKKLANRVSEWAENRRSLKPKNGKEKTSREKRQKSHTREGPLFRCNQEKKKKIPTGVRKGNRTSSKKRNITKPSEGTKEWSKLGGGNQPMRAGIFDQNRIKERSEKASNQLVRKTTWKIPRKRKHGGSTKPQDVGCGKTGPSGGRRNEKEPDLQKFVSQVSRPG